MINHQLSQVVTKISASLDKCGLFYFVHAREKTLESIQKKIDSRNIGYYSENGRKIQDVYGIRVVCYFKEDIAVIRDILSRLFQLQHESTAIDIPGEEVFRAERFNVVFCLGHRIAPSFSENKQLFDDTFELQIRTVFSEGWHEVEHDIRYKRRGDWESNGDLSRILNSYFAVIQSSEWGLGCLFREMSRRALLERNVDGFLSNYLRIRIQEMVSVEICQVVRGNDAFCNCLNGLDRDTFVELLTHLPSRVPLTGDNLIFMLNEYCCGDPQISQLTPDFIKYQMKLAMESQTAAQQ